MTRRRLAAALAVVGILALSGCIGQFGVGVSEDELAQDAEYDWDTNATVTVTLDQGGLLGGSSYRAVYDGEETVLRLSTQGLTRSHSVDVRAVQFRYSNGTVVGHEAIDVSQSARRTVIRLPAEDGQFAFTGDRRSQELELPALDGGRYEVILPAGHQVGDLVLSDVVPRGYETEVVDGRTRVVWSALDADRTLLVRHYSDLGWWLFYGLLAVLSVAGVLVYLYFSREIGKIRAWREAQGFDVDIEDDDRDDPPPGMG